MNVPLTAPGRAWVLLGSGRRLNLLDPQPNDWTDQDLAIGLSRTYRWGGHSKWDLPLSVAQHSLLVLVLRQQMQHAPLTPCEALRELLHDADEGLLGFDPISPLKSHLDGGFDSLTRRLRSAITVRYRLQDWHEDDHILHKRADRLAAASEALHVVGWSAEAIAGMLDIRLRPLQSDPLPMFDGLQPWEPWAPRRAASLFLIKLRELQGASHLEHPADLAFAIERETMLAQLASAFSRLPLPRQRRCAKPVTGNSLTDTFVFVESPDQQHIEGVIVDGERDEEGQWVLDGQFTVFTTEEDLIRVSGWNCTTAVQ